ncbi:MAG: hypothetical protein AAF957_08425 [Planctomycetota bacterium]
MKSIRPLLEAPTYARARLQLGIGGVGTVVVMSILLLALGVPGTLFADRGGSFLADASLLAVWLVAAAVAVVPFEFLGGFVVPRAFGRRHPTGVVWATGWLRGVLVVTLWMCLAGALLVLAGRLGGRPAAVGVLGIVCLLMLMAQSLAAKLVGGIRAGEARLDELDEALGEGNDVPRIDVLAAQDEGFTGGIAGLPGGERLVLPLQWIGRFEADALALLVRRRAAILRNGLRAYGLLAAVAWTLATFALATVLPGAGVATVGALLTTSLWFTLLSFVGLLVLPTPSRAAARAADALTLADGSVDAAALASALSDLDRLQDDEPQRPDGVERIFHPIPALGPRLAAAEALAVDAAVPRPAPWHLARTAIYLSIAGLNPLHRLVHCNVGRPELWVFLPSDG